jgi:hypothetical protein
MTQTHGGYVDLIHIGCDICDHWRQLYFTDTETGSRLGLDVGLCMVSPPGAEAHGNNLSNQTPRLRTFRRSYTCRNYSLNEKRLRARLDG